MKINLNLDKSKTYVLACSFGPDSMALLDACLKDKINVIVAHVNYHHRDESDYEEESLRKYCKERKLRIYILDLKHIKPEGNFEAWARKERYEFFAKVLDETNAESVLIAHNQDDLIETYIMQKKREKYVKNWGIAEKTTIFGTKIMRPLLGYTKASLLEYCKENNVPYSIDKTNLTDEYERNKIRHSIVEKLTEKERLEYLQKIQNEPKFDVEFKPIILVDDFIKFSYQELVTFLDEFLSSKLEHRNISKMFAENIKKSVKTNKENLEIKLTKSMSIFKYENRLYFLDKNNLKKYCIKLDKPGKFNDYIFEGEFTEKSSDRNISKGDFPLEIRNLNPKDKYQINDYQKEVRRLFIDWKVPLFLRGIWPGVYNKDGKLIYIPRYRKEFKDDHKTKFLIKIDSLF